MHRLAAILVALLGSVPAPAADGGDRPLPVLDTGGHVAPVAWVSFLPDGKRLVSVSMDRTVRLWDVDKGKPLGVLRPPIAGEDFGHLTCAALSDKGLLAVGGNTTRDQKDYEVYLIDPAAQKMQRVLRGHAAPLSALCFGKGGERLAGGAADGAVLVWSVRDGKAEKKLEPAKGRIRGLAFSPDGKRLVIAGAGGGCIVTLEGKAVGPLAGGDALAGVAWSPDGQTIVAACPARRALLAWKPDGSAAASHTIPGTPLSCCFTGEGGRVLVGLAAESKHPALRCYGWTMVDLASGKYDNPVLAEPAERRFLAGGVEACCAAPCVARKLVAAAGGQEPAVVLWQRSGTEFRRLAGAGRTVWSVGWGYDNQTIAWGDQWGDKDGFLNFKGHGARPLRYSFSLAELEEKEEVPKDQYERACKMKEDPSEEGGVLTGEFFKRGSRVLADLFEARCGVLVSPDLMAIGSPLPEEGEAAGQGDPLDSWGFRLYELHDPRKGTHIKGHQGVVNALSLSLDHRRLLSGSDDRTLRIWDPNHPEKPLLSLFFAEEDWVAWTPDGHYAASSGGARFLGWQVNEKDALARFYPASRFRDRCSPERIENLLANAKKAAGGPLTAEMLRANDKKVDPPNPQPQPSPDPTPRRRPLLYVLAIGISTELPANASKWPTDAARQLAKVLAERGKPLYRVETKILSDEQATSHSLRQELDALRKRLAPGDVGVVFFAGPGLRDRSGRFYLVPHQADLEKLKETCLEDHRLVEHLLEARGQVVLLLDCYPLSEGRDGRRSAGRHKTVFPNDAVGRAVSRPTGVVVLRSSVRVDPTAEDGESHFLPAIREALEGKADADGSGTVDLDELGAYVVKEVQQRSKGKQKPKMDKPEGLSVLVLTRPDGREEAGPQPGPEETQPGAGEAVLEVSLPPGGRVSIDGADQGDKRRFTYPAPAPGILQPLTVRLTPPGSAEGVLRRVWLRGGWTVRLPLPPPAKDRPEMVLQAEHVPPLWAVALSPDKDSRLTLTAGEDKTATLWDTSSGRKLSPLDGHTDTIHAAAFSPDGKYVLTGSSDKTAVLWDVESGKRVRSFPHPAAVFAVAFSPDGTRILTGADDGTAILWQTDTGAVVQNFQGHQGAVNGVAFATGGKPLTGGGDGKVILWDAATARPAFTFRNEGGAVHALACSRDGKRLAAGYRDGSAVVWELASRKQLHVLRRHRRQVNAVAFAGPAGEWLVTASSDRMAIVWDVAKGEPLGRPLGEGLVEGHDGSIRAVAFRPDGKRLLTGGADRRAVLWELGDRPFPIHAFQSSVQPVSVLAVGPASGGCVLAGSADRGATWWGVTEGAAAGVEGHEGAVTGAAFSRDGKQAVTGSLDGRVHLWDVARRSSKPLQMPEGRFEVLAVALRGDGGAVLAGGRDGRILLWEAGADTPPRVLGRHDGSVNALAFSEDGKRAFSASNDRTAIAWDIADGKCLTRFEEHRWEVRALASSRDGRRLVTGDADGQVVLWDAVAGNKVRTLSRQPARVNAIALSGDGRWVLIGSAQTASLWDAESGERVRTFEGHAGEVRAVAFSPDDRRVLTGSEDGTVRLWDAAVGDDQSRGEEVARLLSLHGGRDWLVLTPEGLFDGSEGGRNKVQFRLAGAVAPVDRYFKALYRPCLLQDLWQGERPLPEVDLAAKRPPTVRFLSPSSGETVSDSQITVEVEAHDGGDGIKDVWLYKLVGSEPFPILATGPAHRKDGVVRRSFVVALTQGENRLKARTTTRDESCDGAPAFLSLTYEKPVPTPPAPKLYLLAVGISNYADQRLNKGVQFAARDAEAMTDVFWRRGPGRLYHRDSRKWLLLNDKATRAGIEAALEEIKAKAQSEDVLVVFLAGHGELGHGEVAAKRYFFIPHEFQPGSAEAVERQGLSWEKLEEYLTQTGVRKQVVVLDTCHSGAALERKSKKGGASPEEKALKSAIVALHRQNGAYAVAAARADEKAFEFETLKHGRLTYTLLAGLGAVADGPLAQRGNEALRDKDGMIDVLEWVLFASKQVPALCRVDNVHPQTPVFKVTGSTPFPLLPATDPSER